MYFTRPRINDFDDPIDAESSEAITQFAVRLQTPNAVALHRFINNDEAARSVAVCVDVDYRQSSANEASLIGRAVAHSLHVWSVGGSSPLAEAWGWADTAITENISDRERHTL